MKYAFPYAFAGSIEIPDQNLLGVIAAKFPHSDQPESQIIAHAIANPVGAPRLLDLVSVGDKVLILTDDNTRLTPADRILPHILAELSAVGVPDSNIQFLNAAGTHRRMTHSEFQAKLGTDILARFRVQNHHWEDLDQLQWVAESEGGIPIYINKLALWADHIIGVGAIFPHAVAGYSGGGKIVIPGITGEATCGDMHWAMYGIPARQLYGIAENPVRAIIDEFALKAGLSYIVDAILDHEGQVIAMVAGHPVQAHRAGAELARQCYGVRVPEPADIVVFDSYKTDLEYWQAIKAITPAGIVMKDGGMVIQVASCPEGVSMSHPEVLEYGYRPLKVVAAMLEQGLFNKSVAAHMIQASEVIVDRGRGFLISEGISAQDIVRLGFLYAESAQAALNQALEMKGSSASILVLRQAGDLLPLMD